MQIELMNYHSETGKRPVLIWKRGRKFVHVLTTEDVGPRVRRLPLRETEYMTPATVKVTKKRLREVYFTNLKYTPEASRKKARQAVKDTLGL